MNRRILVVDDDPAVRRAFDYALRDEGYGLDLVASGPEALEAVQRRRPDLVFLDLRLPEMDGIEVLKRLEASTPGLPVYIVTAYRAEYLQRLQEARDSGLRFEVADKPLRDTHIREITDGFFHPIRLRLYHAAKAEQTEAHATAIRDWLLSRGCTIEIETIDVLEHFERALADDVFATPMLIRLTPGPVRRVLGDLSRTEEVVRKLDLHT